MNSTEKLLLSNFEYKSDTKSGSKEFVLYDINQITLSNCSFESIQYGINYWIISSTTTAWNMSNLINNYINTLRISDSISAYGITNNNIKCFSCDIYNENVTLNLNNYPVSEVIFKANNNCKLENCICSSLVYEIGGPFGLENCSCSSCKFSVQNIAIANLSKCSNITINNITANYYFSNFFSSMLSTSTLGLVNVKIPLFWIHVSQLARKNYAFDNNVIINNAKTTSIALSKDSSLVGVFKNSVIISQPSILSVDFRGWKPSDINGLNNGLFLNIASEAANDVSFTLKVDNANDWAGYKNKIYAFGAAGTDRVIITDQ
jgi:hypothetical protein